MVEKRGRKAAVDAEIVPIMPGDAKPPPPEDMTPLEAVIWKMVVDAMPLRYFGRETWPVLRGLCAHMVAADKLRVRYLAALDSGKPDEIASLATLYNRETQAVRTHSADLRLTKIARISHQVSVDRIKNNQVLRKPWDD